MLLLWNEGIPYWEVGLAYGLVGVGVGFAGTPASHSLTGSVPVERAGMASGTADLQRDLGGAIMQSILGALLTAGYAAAAAAAIGASPNAQKVTDSVSAELTKSFASAEAVGQQYPQYASQITAAAKTSFLQGADWAYTAGIVAIAARRGGRLSLLPEAGRRTAPAGRVPRHGHDRHQGSDRFCGRSRPDPSVSPAGRRNVAGGRWRGTGSADTARWRSTTRPLRPERAKPMAMVTA